MPKKAPKKKEDRCHILKKDEIVHVDMIQIQLTDVIDIREAIINSFIKKSHDLCMRACRSS